MPNKLELITFIIGLAAATLCYFIAKNFQAPLTIFVISVIVVIYQYFYLPMKFKDDGKL